MPRFSLDDYSSSSSSSDDNLRIPKRRRLPFPARVLYRNGSTSTPPAAVTATATAVGSASVRNGFNSDESLFEFSEESASVNEDVDEEVGDDDEEEVEDEEEVATTVVTSRPVIGNSSVVNSNGACNDVVRPGSKEIGVGRTSEPVALTLTDIDVLDCAICFEPFTIPVYQCENGHTACSSCCSKLRNKCPSCCLPIGYNRCRAFEKVLESVKITCLNSKYGCKEKVSYSKKREHEQSCVYEPCSCPLPGCCFDGSYKDLYLHFARKHPASATRFKFDSSFPVHIGASMKYIFLQEHDHTLFILNYGVQSIGNVANIICIGPSSLQKEYSYELEASKGDCSVKLNSLTQSMPKWSVHLPQNSILLVPKNFIDSSREHNIQVCIRRNGEK